MPPRAATAIAQAGPSVPAVPAPSASVPPPGSPTPPMDEADRDAQDMLIIQDLMDTLEQMPAEMTRVHADLNELGAVLYSTLQSLELKLNQLIEWCQDGGIRPEQRFQLLMEIAEEAARYKLGGDDKIRVAAGACDGIMAHQKHISNLLAASTFLESAPPSPYTVNMTLLAQPTVGMSRRQIARAQNSPFTGPGGGRGGPGEGRVGDTPTKKKKSRVQQLGRDDDETSSVGGARKPVKKRKPNPRAPSPTDSIGSNSFARAEFTGPRTARQVAAATAAQAKARKAERGGDDDSDESEPERMPEGKKRTTTGGSSSLGGGHGMAVTASMDSNMHSGLGLDVGGGGGHSRDPSYTIGQGGRSAAATPLLGQGVNRKVRAPGAGPGGGAKKRGEDDGESDEDMPLARASGGPGNGNGNGNGIRGPGGARKPGMPTAAAGNITGDNTDGEAEGDGRLYCVCNSISYGDMVACDNEDCGIEWFHFGCMGLTAMPEGDWLCPACTEKRKRFPNKVKRLPKAPMPKSKVKRTK